MQIQGGRKKPCDFVSHKLSEQATRWGVMELELNVFVFLRQESFSLPSR